MPTLIYDSLTENVLFYSLAVPVIPPSANRTTRAFGTLAPDVAAFDQAIRLFARGKIFTADAKLPLKVTIEVYLPKKKRGDADNFVKPTLDALVKNGVIPGDGQVRECIVRKFRDPKEPRTQIGIEKWRSHARK